MELEEELPPEEPLVSQDEIAILIDSILESFTEAYVQCKCDGEVPADASIFMVRSTKMDSFASNFQAKTNAVEITIYNIEFYLEFNEEGNEELGFKIAMKWK